MALDLFQNSVSAQYLENKWTDFTKLYITINTDKIYVWIFSCYFLHICTSVMALDLRQNFVSISIIENKWTEFHQILYMHSY